MLFRSISLMEQILFFNRHKRLFFFLLSSYFEFWTYFHFPKHVLGKIYDTYFELFIGL